MTRWALHYFFLAWMAFGAVVKGEQLAAERLMTSFEVQMERWMDQMGSAESETLRLKLLSKRPSEADQLQRLWRQIENHLDEEWVLRPLGWMFSRPAAWSGLPDEERLKAFGRAMDAVEHNLVLSKDLGEVVPALAALEHQRCLGVANKVIQVNPHDSVKAQAHIAVALILRKLGDSPKVLRQRREHLRKALELGGDAPFGRRLVIEMVQDELYRVKNLSVGKQAPVFTLRDQEGQEVSLLNYRGRVTVLVFWSVKSLSSLQQLPVMEALLKNLGPLEGELALLGVVTDASADVKEFIEAHEVTFDNLVDLGGRVASDYRVEAFPAVFILDRDGRIAYTGMLSPLLRPQIEELAKEGMKSLLPNTP